MTRRSMCLVVPSLIGLIVAWTLPAATLYSPNPHPAPLSATVTNTTLRTISPGLLEVGKVRLDKGQRILSFPASLNMTNGLVEYLLVSSIGKLHESILQTDAEPYHIHVAALLLSKPVSGQSTTNPTNIVDQRVEIQIAWKVDGVEITRRGEELVLNSQNKTTMSRGPWIYAGSRLDDGTFLAQRDGSIISIIHDPDALVDNPRPGNDNDEIWQPNAWRLPPSGTNLEIRIKFVGEQHSSKPAGKSP